MVVTEDEHPLARRIGCRPYSELSPEERDSIAAFLVDFERKYGKPEGFDPQNYWWKQGDSGEWDAFNTKAVIAEENPLY